MVVGRNTVTFAVPVTAAQRAPEVLYLRVTGSQVGSMFDPVSEATIHVESLPAGSQIEVDILKPGGAEADAAGWLTNVQTYTTTGLKQLLQLARIHGVRLRATSGGVAGNAVVHCWWW